ncbi:MAG TPA: hypothetical protein VH637_08525 [Streptosporangiaceae bacterium]
MPAEQLRQAESFLAVTTGLEELGLSLSDAQTLSQTVLTELVENVAEHGRVGEQTPLALIGALLLGAETYAMRQSGMHARLAEIAERAISDGSYVLRLIVADSGAALADPHAPAALSPGLALTSKSARPEIIVLSVLGGPPGQAPADAAPPAGTGGLPWVSRVVRTYRGGILVRSSDWLAGLLFGKSAEGASVAEAGLSRTPGMLLELTLLTGSHPPRNGAPWGNPSPVADVSHLRWLNCEFKVGHGLGEADKSRLTAQIGGTLPQRNAAGLVVTIPVQPGENPIDDRWHAAMNNALRLVTSIARSAAIVLIFPDAEPHLLHPSIAAFDEQVTVAAYRPEHTSAGGTEAPETCSPVLVLGSHGSPVWCGGSPPLRAVLNALSGSEGSLGIAAARDRWQAAGGEPAQFLRRLHEHSHLISTTRDQLDLRISTFSVHGTIEREISHDLAEAIEQGSDGVERGIFRGPTLRITNRWIDVERLLAGTVGVQLAAFVLAHKARRTLRAAYQPREPTGIVQVGSLSRTFIRHVSECMMLAGDYYQQQSEIDPNQPPIGGRIPPSAQVVFCTDLISTENTVLRAVASAIAANAQPLAIVCVVDARHTRRPVRLLDRTIPVVSLVEVDISVSDETAKDLPVTDIDPLLKSPAETAPASLAEVQEAGLLRWCAADPDVLRLGHIDGQPQRHFSAFIRLHALRSQQIREQITDEFLATMEQALADIGAASEPRLDLALWYVKSDGNAERLATAVRERLTARGTTVSVVPVPRWAAGDEWAFPGRLSTAGRTNLVVIIHWWALTGSTILQLIRLAAKSGARQIAAICLLNQLNAQDTEVLHMLRTVSAPSDGAIGGHRVTGHAQPIPVVIRFVTVNSTSDLDARSCAICATGNRYAELSGDAVPHRLRQHAELLHHMLRLRDLDEVSRDAAADLFTVPVSSDEALDYLRWRGLLLSALRRVPERQEAINALGMLAAGTTRTTLRRDGLIRLLAAEQQWLRLPPLNFGTARDLLVQVCVLSLEQPARPPWLRVQALMVLSAAAPQDLAELLRHLLNLVVDEAILVDQLFLDCWRLLLQPPPGSPFDIGKLRHSLVGCRDYLEERDSSTGIPVDEHLHVVGELITITDYQILRKPKDAQAAWDRLREDLVRPVVRHRLETELLLVRSVVEDIEDISPPAPAVVEVRARWNTCARQLEERALANLPALRDILAGDFVADWFGPPDQRRLLGLARHDVRELRAVAERLHRLIDGPPRPGDHARQVLRRELLDRINWWNRVFLAAHLPDRHAPALLVDLVRSAPVNLSLRVTSILALHRAQATVSSPDRGDVAVFCPERLLDQVLGHLLENVRKHQLPGAACRLGVDYAPAGPEAVRLVLRNSGTAPRQLPGKGIRALNDKLRPFGGSVNGLALSDDGWTFAAVVTLPLWYGG